MPGALHLLLAVALTGAAAAAEREPPAPLPLVHRHFSIGDGLPDTAVQALVQSRDGFLWVAAEGIGRFNGSTFRLLTEANTPGLPESDIHTVVEDGEGGLWFGGEETEGRRGPLVLRLLRGKLTRFGPDQGGAHEGDAVGEYSAQQRQLRWRPPRNVPLAWPSHRRQVEGPLRRAAVVEYLLNG